MRALELLAAYLFPPKCVFCGKLLEREETDMCANCRKGLPAAEQTNRTLRYVDAWTAVYYYENDVRESLLRFKFSGKRYYAETYGRLLAMKLQWELAGEVPVLTYVPVSFWRRRKRGYDQVALLAKAVGGELGIPVVCTLKKIRNNPAQSKMKDAAGRRANVSGVYRMRKIDIRDKKILLLDDILTTGATISECARVLRTAGAASVTAAAVACVRPKRKD